MHVIPYETPNQPVYIYSPRIVYLGPDGNYTANPVSGILEYAAQGAIPTTNLTGKVLAIHTASGQSLEAAVRLLLNSGVNAVISVAYLDDDPGSENWIRDGTFPGQQFPVYAVGTPQNVSLATWFNNQTAHGCLIVLTDEINDWDETYRVGIPIIAYSILIFNCFLAIVTTYKLTLTILVRGWVLSLPMVVYIMNLIGSIIRIMFSAGNPFGVWGTSGFLYSQITMTLSLPFSVGSVLLISLYWHEMVVASSGKRVNAFLGKLKVPFACFVGFTLVWEVIAATLRGLYYAQLLIVYLDGAIYLIITLFTTIFFIVTRIRLQEVFNQINKTLGANEKNKLALATFHFAAMAVSLVIWIIIVIVAGVVGSNHIAFPIIWGTYFLSLGLLSLFQVLMIRAPLRPWKWILCGLFITNPGDLLTEPDSGKKTSIMAGSTSTFASLSAAQMSSM